MNFTEKTKAAFLNTINDQGFVLEHRLHSMLKRHFAIHQPKRGDVVFFQETRREIDSILDMGRTNFIFECKRSIFDYFFLAPSDYPSDLHIIQHLDRGEKRPHGIYTRNVHVPSRIKTSADCIEIPIDSKGNPSTRKYDKGRLVGEEYASTSSREDYIHSKIKQVLCNTEAFIWKKMGLDSSKPDLMKTVNNNFYPVIVTNADLYFLSYSENDVSENSTLTDINAPVAVKYLAYNFSDSIKWGDRLKEVEYLVEEELGHCSKNHRGSHIKSVFVVNIKYVIEFIDMITGMTKNNNDEIESVIFNALQKVIPGQSAKVESSHQTR